MYRLIARYSLVAGLPLAVPCMACQATSHQPGKTAASVKTSEESSSGTIAKTAPDDSWISLSGTVAATSPDSFVLDYGSGNIVVEMDDYDWYPEGNQLLVNDEVIVYGFVDADFYERRTIEASSVYAKDLGTQFFASGMDEEDFPAVAALEFRPRFEVTGNVRSVQGDEFKLGTQAGVIDVDTTQMLYDPLDDEGYQKIVAGDRVRVVGQLQETLFDELELVADRVVTLKATR